MSESKSTREKAPLATDSEINSVRELAQEAYDCLTNHGTGVSTAPIVRFFRWQEDRGLHVLLELLQRDAAARGVR